MGKLRCYCLDLNCRGSAPVIEPTGSSTGASAAQIAITRSVGQGGVNIRTDVIAVQRALNAVGASRGGPTLALATDGLVGPKTIAAIGKFQKQNISFVDFRVDPNGPTIQALNRLLGLSPPAPPTFTVTDEMMESAFNNILPLSRACVKTALRTLAAAKTMGTIESPAQTLVRKHFAVLLSDPPPQDFALIERTFRAIDREMALAALSPATTFIKFPFTMSYEELATSRILAMSLMNGVAESGQVVKLDTKDGKTATLRADAVVLMPLYFFADPDLQIGTLIHELGHFVGKPDGSDDGIDDPPGGSSGDAALAQLRPEQRPRIAECYAMFAFEAHFGRSMFRHTLKF